MDSDLIFEERIGNPLRDDKISNQSNENLNGNLDKKLESDGKQEVKNSEIERVGWMNRMKRSLSSFFNENKEEIVSTIEANHETIDLLNDSNMVLSRRRRQSDDEEDDDEDNEISSGDHETPADVTTTLPPVKDDKYCKSGKKQNKSHN